MRKAIAGIVVAVVLFGGLFVYDVGRKREIDGEALQRLIATLSAVDGFEQDRELYVRLADKAHAPAFESCYAGRRWRRWHHQAPHLDDDGYRQAVFMLMIAEARQAGRDDIAVVLHRLRADTRW